MKKKDKKIKAETVKKTIKCRRCFMSDSYAPDQKKCFHCGAEIFDIDAI